MGCGASQSATSSVRVYVPVKAKSSATPTSKGQPRLGGPRGSSDSLKSFSDSALNVKLSTDKNLVLLWDGELPGASAYYEQAVMVLKIKGIEYTEEIISSSNPPSWFQGIHDASLPFLVWKDRSTKDVTPAGRADIKGLFKFVEDHVKHPRLFIPSCMDDTRNLGRQGLNQLDGDLHALLSLENPLAVSKLREAVVASLAVIDKSISEKKYVGPFMFGTSISVVDVIYAPLFVRLDAATRVRGLDVPTALTHFHRYRDEMMSTEVVQSMVLSVDSIIRRYEPLAQRSAINLPCFALQDKAISRHFKSVITAADAAAAGKEGAATKLLHKFNRLQTLVVCKGATTARMLPSILGESITSNATLSSLHDKTVEEFDRVRTVIVAFASAGTEAQPNAAQDCLNALNTLQESQAKLRGESLDLLFQLYRAATHERRWIAQRVFFGGSTHFAGLFDPWTDLTPYVIEGLTAEETELYLWQANLASTAVGDAPEVFRSFLSSISAAAARGVINELAWQTIQARILRHAAQSAAMTLQTAKTTASASGGRKSGARSVDRSNTRTSRAASVTMNE